MICFNIDGVLLHNNDDVKNCKDDCYCDVVADVDAAAAVVVFHYEMINRCVRLPYDTH